MIRGRDGHELRRCDVGHAVRGQHCCHQDRREQVAACRKEEFQRSTDRAGGETPTWRTPAPALTATSDFFWPDLGGTVPCGIYLLMVSAHHYQEEHLPEVVSKANSS